jgi:hypothetical protein
MALASTCVNHIVWPLKVSAQGKARPRATARNLIMIDMGGCISPQDCWDFKPHPLQPKDLELKKLSDEVTLSKTLFPQMVDQWDKVALVRSMRANELVHFNGQYHTQTGRVLAPALAKEVPAFGSIIASELDAQRKEGDSFPTYISTSLATARAGSIGAGFLPARFSALDLNSLTVFETFGGSSEGLNKLLEERWTRLSALSEASQEEWMSLGDKASDFKSHYRDAYRILNDPRWNKVFQASEDDKKRYGDDEYGLGLILARNLLRENAGTRVVYIYDGDRWDQHAKIFDRSQRLNHYVNAVRWDKGFASLLADLSATPGTQAGKTMLDETLVVSTSEFGRTPDINPVLGRHHWRFSYTSLLAGGGVKGGRVLGKSDAQGAYNVETGWKHKEQPFMDNIVATMYSALGIDWLKRVTNTPSGRDYDYVQSAPIGGAEFIATDAIDELFA